MRGGAFFNGKEGRDDFRKLSFWLKGDGGIRKTPSLRVKRDGVIFEKPHSNDDKCRAILQ
ncbi:hypothetical protein DW917_13365 [Prevotella sp. AM42-24]|nr:hypothetical protein DW917_13365 [Prevotella sp. AM42-24]